MSKKILRVYLDNCCYNRPYDDQSQIRISLEAQAKIFVQTLVKEKRLELATSYVLLFENSKNPHINRQQAIRQFIKQNTSFFVDTNQVDKVIELAREIMRTGVKEVDASHVACAILAECDYFLTTDDRLLKFRSDKIIVTDPVTFVKTWEATDNE